MSLNVSTLEKAAEEGIATCYSYDLHSQVASFIAFHFVDQILLV